MKIVDLNIIKSNYLSIDRIIYAVVKNDAYGLGLNKIANLLINLGVNRFCCNKLSEAIELRNINKDIYILLLSDFDIDKIDIYKLYNITVTLSFVEKLKYLKDLNFEVKLNKGLNRYGLKEYIKLDKIYYTHLPNFSNTLYDVDHFITTKGLNYKSNLARVGMALYKDSLEVYEKIRNIWYVKKNEFVGYNYQALKNMYVGVINIGYYNGLSSNNIGRYVYINKLYKIIEINMNHSFIEIDESVKMNDLVELMGKNISVDYLSKYLNISDYEAFTMIHDDIKYKGD